MLQVLNYFKINRQSYKSQIYFNAVLCIKINKHLKTIVLFLVRNFQIFGEIGKDPQMLQLSQ